MPDAVEGVESERRCQYDLGGILDCLGKPRDDLQYMYGVESPRSGKVCQEVAVHHCNGLGKGDGGRRVVLTNTEIGRAHV